MADDRAQCPRCLEFQDEVRQLQQRLAASGQYVTYSPGPTPGFNVEHELERWLAVKPALDAGRRVPRRVGSDGQTGRSQTTRMGSTLVALGT